MDDEPSHLVMIRIKNEFDALNEEMSAHRRGISIASKKRTELIKKYSINYTPKQLAGIFGLSKARIYQILDS